VPRRGLLPGAARRQDRVSVAAASPEPARRWRTSS